MSRRIWRDQRVVGAERAFVSGSPGHILATVTGYFAEIRLEKIQCLYVQRHRRAGVPEHATPMSFFQVMMQRGFETMAAEDTAVSVDQAALATRELHKLTRDGADEMERWASVHAKHAKVVGGFPRVHPARAASGVLGPARGQHAASVRQRATGTGRGHGRRGVRSPWPRR